MRNLIFLICETQHNFRNELFDTVEEQRNPTIAERHFRTELKHNLTFAIEISQLNANFSFSAILDRNRVNNLPKKADIFQHCDRNGTKLCSTYRIALLTGKKKLKAHAV